MLEFILLLLIMLGISRIIWVQHYRWRIKRREEQMFETIEHYLLSRKREKDRFDCRNTFCSNNDGDGVCYIAHCSQREEIKPNEKIVTSKERLERRKKN